jgi:hypothetical protein
MAADYTHFIHTQQEARKFALGWLDAIMTT